MPNIYLAHWKWIEEQPGFFSWNAPSGGQIGALDLRSIPQQASPGGVPVGWGVFVYDSPQTIAGSINFGESLSRSLTESEKTVIQSSFSLSKKPTGATVRDLLWDLLTKYSDSTGLIAAKPLMPTISGNLELNLGGFSKIKSEKFDINTHPHRDKVLTVIQNDYRRIRREDLIARSDHYKRVLDALSKKYGVPYQNFIPSDLPDEGKLPAKTTIGDTFVETSDTTLASHTATGPDGGFSWNKDAGDTNSDGTVVAATDDLQGNTNPGTYRALSSLSSGDHFVQANIQEKTGDSGTRENSVLSRKDDSTTLDFFEGQMRSANDRLQHRKWIAGSPTHLGSSPIIFTFNVVSNDTPSLTSYS